jgi:hypothetical protein
MMSEFEFDHRWQKKSTYCLAAKIICAFRSLKLASRFSGVSSQTALPPISVCGSGAADEEGKEVQEEETMRD